MAIKIKTKAKPKKITRSAIKSFDDKAYGPEPIQIKSFTDALNWYNYMSDEDQSRDWFFTYVKKNYTKGEVAALRKLPKWKISKTLGSVARILTNGNELPQKNMDYFDRSVKDLVKMAASVVEKVETEETPKTTVTIQDRVQAKIYNLITDCEEAVDTIQDFNVYNWLQAKEATPQAANALREYYSKFAADHEPDEFDTPAMKKHRAQLKKYWEEFVPLIDR